MKKKFFQTIDRHKLLEKDMHIVVGLSGGPDSMCLFDLLCNGAPQMNWTLEAVHINHSLRPGDADTDQRYVEEVCKTRGIACHVYHVDCLAMARELDMTSEEAGRKARYEAFSDTALKILEKNPGLPKEKVVIAVAHNADDQAETILFRILRGTGIDGLAGIPYKRYDENGFAIVRPILDMSRKEIEEYCDRADLQPRIDHTNSENIYTRNKIRNMLIPYIQENFNENIIETINRLGKIAAADRDFMSKNVDEAYNEALCKSEPTLNCDKIEFQAESILRLHRSVRVRLYTKALENLGMAQNLTYAQAEGIDSVLMSDSPSAMYNLADGFIAAREYDKLTFRKKIESKSDERALGWRISELTSTEFDKIRHRRVHDHGRSDEQGRNQVHAQEHKHTHLQNPPYAAAFSGVRAADLAIRTRKQGDYIVTAAGRKKIQDFFVDEKVPKQYRDEMLLLAKGSQVLWVMPSEHFAKENLRKKGRFSANFRVLQTTEQAVSQTTERAVPQGLPKSVAPQSEQSAPQAEQAALQKTEKTAPHEAQQNDELRQISSAALGDTIEETTIIILEKL